MASVNPVVLVLSVLALSGCTSTRESATTHPPGHALAPEIVNAWAVNHEVLDRVARGGQLDVQEYMRAVEFFEHATRIQARDMKTFGGRFPNEYLEADLLAWDSWREKNAACLRWNALQGLVECDQTKTQ